MRIKRCPTCEKTKPITEFHKSANRGDGHTGLCKRCANERARARSKSGARKTSYTKWNKSQGARDAQRKYTRSEKGKARRWRYITHVKARAAVQNEVKYGRLPPILTQKCNNCEQQSIAYHHHLGYEQEHWLDVIPMCQECHTAAHI